MLQNIDRLQFGDCSVANTHYTELCDHPLFVCCFNLRYCCSSAITSFCVAALMEWSEKISSPAFNDCYIYCHKHIHTFHFVSSRCTIDTRLTSSCYMPIRSGFREPDGDRGARGYITDLLAFERQMEVTKLHSSQYFATLVNRIYLRCVLLKLKTSSASCIAVTDCHYYCSCSSAQNRKNKPTTEHCLVCLQFL